MIACLVPGSGIWTFCAKESVGFQFSVFGYLFAELESCYCYALRSDSEQIMYRQLYFTSESTVCLPASMVEVDLGGHHILVAPSRDE